MDNTYLVYYKYRLYDGINIEQNCVITLTRTDLVEARHDVNAIKKKNMWSWYIISWDSYGYHGNLSVRLE